MTPFSKYLVALAKKYEFAYASMTTFYSYGPGKRIFYEEDLKPEMQKIKKTIVGFTYDKVSPIFNWIRLGPRNSIEFELTNIDLGSVFLDINELLQSKYDSICESIVLQMLMMSDKHNVFVGTKQIINKGNAYAVLAHIDLDDINNFKSI